VHRVGLEERLGVALRRARIADDVEDRGRVGYVDRGPGPADELERRLAVVGHERVDVHQRLYVTASGRCVRDDEAAYEWPTRTTGPVVRWASNDATYAASAATPRSRFGGARTVKSWLCSPAATAFQLDASAHAPWTRTIVGFGSLPPVGPSPSRGPLAENLETRSRAHQNLVVDEHPQFR
jgi:hypothetical protein